MVYNRYIKKKPIHLACQTGSLDVVKFLLSKGCNIDAENRVVDYYKYL